MLPPDRPNRSGGPGLDLESAGFPCVVSELSRGPKELNKDQLVVGAVEEAREPEKLTLPCFHLSQSTTTTAHGPPVSPAL